MRNYGYSDALRQRWEWLSSFMDQGDVRDWTINYTIPRMPESWPGDEERWVTRFLISQGRPITRSSVDIALKEYWKEYG